MKLSRPTHRFAVRLTAALSVTAALVCPAIAADKVTLQLSWLPQGQASALYYGIQKGCFAEQQIDLSVQRGYGNSDTLNKIVAKNAQFGQLDLGSVIVAREKHQAPLKAVMPLFSDSPLTIAVLDGSPVKTMKDLEGRSVAAGPGEGGVLLMPIAVKNAGGDMSKVVMRTIEPSALAGSLLQKNVDGIVTYVTTAAGIDMVAKKAGLSIRTVDYGSSLGIYGDAFIASEDLIRTSPGLVDRFRKGTGCAYRDAQKEPEAAVRAMVAALPEMDFNQQLVLAKMGWRLVFGSQSPALEWDESKLKKTAEVTTVAQNLPSVADPASFAYR
jgi:NitT/TauT family transport system substrate-binding protein